MAHITLRKLTGIQTNHIGDDNKIITNKLDSTSNFSETINGLAGKKLVFAGQDYKGTLDIPTDEAKSGTLELYLKGPDDYLKIEGVNVTKSTSTNPHTLSEGTATIYIASARSGLNILERNNEWLTTQLDMQGVTAVNSSIKFGEWNNYDLPDKCHVEINFA
ncbi:MAG: hypothetical protein LKM45_01150 [Wolbachia endosymbiont of Alcedoecus sp.]|nr:hypothetical protein [Wolbachia endosymbiont of Alcedoecus sp.]